MNDKPHILLVDDELSVREMLSILLQRNNYQVTLAQNGHEALEILKAGNRFHLAITDLAMDQGSGLEVLESIKERDKDCPVILITAFGTTQTAVQAIKMGAYDYINKPFDIEEFKLVVEGALAHRNLLLENQQLKQRLKAQGEISDLVGVSESLKKIRALCLKINNSPSSVLLYGESGTGKEVIARAIHYSSTKKDKPFVPVNCGALPEHLMESELFGHVKGSFTGADTDKTGLVRSAHQGTLFLDEIGELPLPLQVKLLRVLQDKKVRPVGAQKETEVDVRIISATNRNLEYLIKHQLFREDLYYRLNVITITIPPLRDRPEDIKPLIQTLMPQICANMNQQVPQINKEAMRALLNYDYPGNVRELKNILERAATLCSDNIILPEDLPENLKNPAHSLLSKLPSIPPAGIELEHKIAEYEKKHIESALKQTGGVQSAAAKLLGITVRSLRYRLEKNEDESQG